MPKRSPKQAVQVGQSYLTKYGTFTVTAMTDTSLDVRHEGSGRVARYGLSDFETWIIQEKKP